MSPPGVMNSASLFLSLLVSPTLVGVCLQLIPAHIKVRDPTGPLLSADRHYSSAICSLVFISLLQARLHIFPVPAYELVSSRCSQFTSLDEMKMEVCCCVKSYLI